ncbi:MAG: GTP pyrophosphokinase family protein [Lachnospiraceae bacterium]|nr:GTP pyrophosphokinase family protein [Lachnospiraceae bacterium]
MAESIYGVYEENLIKIKENLEKRFEEYQQVIYKKTGDKAFEHMAVRIKSNESMREKCTRKGLPQTAESALSKIKDAIGFRIICPFVEDVFAIVEYIRSFDDSEIIAEKDYIRHAKPNGYRSYHIILAVHTDYPDVLGNEQGIYYAEFQIRTIAMDTWAALEHKLKYKKNIPNEALLVAELKKVADELASCDLSLQTIRELIEQA